MDLLVNIVCRWSGRGGARSSWGVGKQDDPELVSFCLVFKIISWDTRLAQSVEYGGRLLISGL